MENFLKLCLVLSFILAVLGSVTASDSLGDPGFVKGDILYPADRFIESTSLLVVLTPREMANSRTAMARERLAEAARLNKQEKYGKAEAVAEDYVATMEKGQKISGPVSHIISESAFEHTEILQRMKVLPGNSLYTPKVKSGEIAVISETEPMEKAEKQAYLTNQRLNSSKIALERGRIQTSLNLLASYESEMMKLRAIGDSLQNRSGQEYRELMTDLTSSHAERIRYMKNESPKEVERTYRQAFMRAKARERTYTTGDKVSEKDERLPKNFSRVIRERINTSARAR